MSDFGFIGGAYAAASPTQDCRETINWYPEVDSEKEMFPGGSLKMDETQGDRGVIALYPCPGTVTLAELISGEVRGMHVLPGGQIMLVACGNNLYSVTTVYGKTIIGTLQSVSGQVYITDNGVAAYITDGVTRYSYIWGINTFAVMTDGGFTNGTMCDEVDNYMIYNNPGTNQFGCTNVGDIVSGGLNFGSMLSSSKYLVGLIVDHRQIALMGEATSERWIDVGTFPFPFSIIPGTSIQLGLCAPHSLRKFSAGFAFLAQNERGNATVCMWGASFSEPVSISTYAIENAIQGYAVVNDAIGQVYSQGSHEFYMLTFPTADVTWVYDISSKMWHKRAWTDPATGLLHRHRSNCCAAFNNQIVVGDYQNGKLYELSQSVYTDDGDLITCVRVGPHIVNDLKRMFFSDLQIQFQPGVGNAVDPGSNPMCMLSWSKDGSFTWNNEQQIPIGKIGQYKNRAIKRKLGWARDIVFKVRVTDPVYRAMVSVNLNMTVGAN